MGPHSSFPEIRWARAAYNNDATYMLSAMISKVMTEVRLPQTSSEPLGIDDRS